MITAEFLSTFAKTHDILIGTCDASPLNPDNLKKSDFVPFVTKDINKRTNPASILKNAKSVIAIGVGQNISASYLSKGTAEISSLGVDGDYHKRVKSLLYKLVDEIKKHADLKYKILVDSPTLDERAFAHRAGLGFFGLNGLLISERFGSFFNIGLLITDIAIETTSKEKPRACPPNCRLCIKSCPNNAIENALNASLCISYLTQKDKLTDHEEKLLHNQLYGCDICQNVCPFNKHSQKYYVNLDEWLKMDDSDFNNKYGHTAMLWRGSEILKRNGNIIGSQSK